MPLFRRLSTLSRKEQQTCQHSLLTEKQLPARSQVAASAVVVQPNGGFAAVLAAASGDWWRILVWVCVAVLGLTLQVFVDPVHSLHLAVERLLEHPAGSLETCGHRKIRRAQPSRR